MTKRIIGILAVLALVVAACGESTSSDDTTAATTPATEAPATSGGDAEAGFTLFSATCTACHGPNGEGVEGLGKPLIGSEFAAGLSDQELVDFIKAGRSPDDPANTTGVAMPPKGGNPALSDADLLNIVAWIRSING